MVQVDDVAAVPGDILDHMLQRGAVEQLAQLRHRQAAGRGDGFLPHRHRIGEDPRVAAHQHLQERHHGRIGQIYIIQCVAIHQDAHLRGHLDILGEGQVLRALQVFQGIVHGRGLEPEMLRESRQVEFQLPADPRFVRDFEEDMELLVDVGDVLQRREGDVQQLPQAPHVHAVPEQDGPGALPVPAGAARFLEIGLRALRQARMHHESHVRLVYAHAEGVGAHHHADAPPFPGFLALRTHFPAQAGMVGRGADPVFLQESGHLLAAAAVAHVHDPGSRDAAADVQQLPRLVLAAAYDIGEVGPLEAAPEQQPLPEAELVHDVLRHLRRGRGREGDHGRIHELAQRADLQVIRAEVIAPLRDAVRLVHDDVAQGQHVQVRPEQGRAEALGRDVQELEIPVRRVVEGEVHLPAVHPGVDGQGADPPVGEVLHLVLHQGDQRRDHERKALLHQGGHLEAHGLAPAGGQDGQHVAPFRRGGNDLLLHRPEGFIAPILLQYFPCFHLCKFIRFSPESSAARALEKCGKIIIFA